MELILQVFLIHHFMKDVLSTFYEIDFMWMLLDHTDDKSPLLQVMARAVRQQDISWANVDPDLCCQMASLSHTELSIIPKCVTDTCIDWGYIIIFPWMNNDVLF